MNDLKPSRIITCFRFGERNDIREFITPNVYEVEEVYSQFESLPEQERIIGLWRWVVESISYPLTRRGALTDLHSLCAFEIDNYPIVGPIWLLRRRQSEYFQMPAETISWKRGDCEDSAEVLTSLLRRFIPQTRVFTAAGFIGNWGHVWTEVDGRCLETTLDYLPVSPPIMYSGYVAQARFNDELCYGELAIPDIRALPLVERLWGMQTKLRRMSHAAV